MKLFRSQSSEGDQGTDEAHTIFHPYCNDLNCWCHTDIAYHDDVQHPDRHQTDEEVEQAFSFFGLHRR